ncbi:MAG: dipicolinate synthase subunit B [Defluviitaleaceae bacterium]|nr:dipicolinate synthase subunit B [Defluviitaleaceae bacterium]MCL2239761.1 dipicolinate synthase subunit B [Defluviitaleaceae bacterium]
MNPFEKLRVGFALTGSFCTLETAFTCMEALILKGADITPIISHATATLDTRFGTAEETKRRLTLLTGRPPLSTVSEAEPIGPGKLLDILLILPATGNTLAKLAAGIADTAVTMAAKSHLRNNRPVVLALSSNDALAGGAKNIGHLLNTRNIYFVPFNQDAPAEKPRSMVFLTGKVMPAMEAALKGEQVQPIIG